MGREAWIGNTDQAWFKYLRAIGATRVNFWYPSPTPEPVQRLAKGDLFFFRLKEPINKIGGGGRLEDVLTLTIDEAWEKFGQTNGVPTRDRLISLIGDANRRNRRAVPGEPGLWEIGCVILRDCVFLADGAFLPQPSDWKKNTVRGRYYPLGALDPSLLRMLERPAAAPGTDTLRREGRELIEKLADADLAVVVDLLRHLAGRSKI